MAVDMIIKEENDIQEKDIKEEIINIDDDDNDDDTETIFDKKEDLITPYSLSFKDYFFQSEDYDEKEQKNIKTHLDNLNHILDLVDFIISPNATYITGQNIEVAGGYMMSLNTHHV